MFSCDWITSTPRSTPVDYIKKPQVILRIIILILTVTIFGVVHNDCFVYDTCLFNDDSASCGFSHFQSITTISLCIVFLLLDIVVDNIPNYYTRKRVILIDFTAIAIWSTFWFILFCLLCNRWQNTPDKWITDLHVSSGGPKAAITLTFFTLVALLILSYFCYLAVKSVNLLAAQFDDTMSQPPVMPPSSFGGVPGSNYHGFSSVDDTNLLDPSQPAELDDSFIPGPKLHFGDRAMDSYQP